MGLAAQAQTRLRLEPKRLLVAQAPHALRAERADALLLVGDAPNGREPTGQRGAGASEDRARRDRRVATACRAAPQAVGALPLAAVDHFAEPTHESIAPAQPFEVAQARRVVREPGQQLMPVARVVDARLRMLRRAATRRAEGKQIAHIT